MVGPLAVGAIGMSDDSGDYYLVFGRRVQARHSSAVSSAKLRADCVNEF
ncbi:hypothetical protein [Thalassospira sp. MCCC 1A01148]|nr:hypothetical protein [Thalassospira sp. MCCC 1A01148]